MIAKSTIIAGVVAAVGVGIIRHVEIRTGFKTIDIGGPATGKFPLPDVVKKNGVPITLALAPLAAAYLVNKYF